MHLLMLLVPLLLSYSIISWYLITLLYALSLWYGIAASWIIIIAIGSIATRRYPPKNIPVLFKTKVEHGLDAVIWGVLLILIALSVLAMCPTMFGVTLPWFLPK